MERINQIKARIYDRKEVDDMKKYQTGIISKYEMEKYLTDCGIENPLEIMKEAIKNKTSFYISVLKAKLEWIYCGDKQWNFQGGNSDNLDDYNYQIMPQ